MRKPAAPSSADPKSAHDLDALAGYHAYTRERGTSRLVYVSARLLVQPLILTYFSLTRSGREHVPKTGPTLVIANHRSFLDPFLLVVLMPWSRRINFMAKAELFARPRFGWLLNRAGAFPVRRGESDPDATETSRIVLQRGGALVIFPEGTRVRSGGLAKPRRGAGRIAVQTGAYVLPVTVTGSEKTRRKFLILPRHCEVHASPAVKTRREQPTRERAETALDEAWEAIEKQWLALGGSAQPGLHDTPKGKLWQRTHTTRSRLSELANREVTVSRLKELANRKVTLPSFRLPRSRKRG